MRGAHPTRAKGAAYAAQGNGCRGGSHHFLRAGGLWWGWGIRVPPPPPRSRAPVRSPWSRARTPPVSSRASWTTGTRHHPDEKARLIELPQDADSQREKMLQNAQTKSDAYDVLSTDVVWTSEFAANRVIIPLPESEFPLDKMLKPVVDTTKYQGKLYAAPSTSDGGMLYYRTDLLKAAGIAKPADHVGRADRGLQEGPGDAAGQGCGLLRRSVREVRRPHRERLRGDQRRRRRGDRRLGQAERRHPRGGQGPRLPGERLQGGLHPQGGHHLQGGGGPRVLPGRQADLPPQLAVRVQPGQR